MQGNEFANKIIEGSSINKIKQPPEKKANSVSPTKFLDQIKNARIAKLIR